MDEECRTLWCGNLSDKVTEEVLYELFVQAAPLQRVRIPTDKNGRKSNYAFITVKHEVSVNYVLELLDGTSLYDRRITIKPRNSNSNNRNPPQSNFVDINNLVIMGQLLQPMSTQLQQNFHNDRYDKPYQRQNDFSGRQNWNHNRNNRKQRRYY